MIVRCKNCESSFAVEDARVENKKFGFTCPKCQTENIIDNRAVQEEDIISSFGNNLNDDSAVEESPIPANENPDGGGADDFSDMDDFDFESEISASEEPAHKAVAVEEPEVSEDDAFDLDIDLEEGGLEEDIPANEGHYPREEKKEESEIDFEADLEGFDLEGFDEPEPEAEKAGEPDSVLSAGDDFFPEDAELTAEDVGIFFDAPESAAVETKPAGPASDDSAAEEEFFSERYQEPEDLEDESVTIDLDTLDIDISDIGEPALEEAGLPDADDEEDEAITLDLDSLDIDIAEESAEPAEEDIDESITLDLDTLDIPIVESSEISQGIELEEDEKLTLADAGLTLDELAGDEISAVVDDTSDEHFVDEDYHTIEAGDDDIPDIDIDEVDLELDDESDLEDIEFEEYAEPVPAAAVRRQKPLDYDLDETLDSVDDRPEYINALEYESSGSVTLSVDYTLRYSRLGALARLTGLFVIALLPHFIVLAVYTALSAVLGVINNIMALATRQRMDDFSEIIEKTIRQFLSIKTSTVGIVEELPVFGGRRDLDFPMQLNVTYPLGYSRFLAFMRLSVAGIVLLSLPHILILLVAGLAVPFLYICGIISVILTARWPSFLFNALCGYYQYMARVMAYMTGLVDKYPPFTF